MEDQGPGGPGPDHPERPGGRPDRSGRPSARAGRRGNGLPAEAFSALTEIDPRLAGTVLEALAEAGIAAWVRPFAGTRGGYLEMRVPARPLDCLFVDASRRGDALSVLAEQVPDLLGLRGRDADEGSAEGATASPSGAGDGAAGEAAGAPGSSGAGSAGAESSGAGGSGAGGSGAGGSGAGGAAAETGPEAAGDVPDTPASRIPGHGTADPKGTGAGLDIEAAFAAIVAGYTREAHNPYDLPPGSQPDRTAGGGPGDSAPGDSAPGDSAPGDSGPDGGGTSNSSAGDSGPDGGGTRNSSAGDGSPQSWGTGDINAPGRPDAPPARPASTWFVPASEQPPHGAPGAGPRDVSDPDLDDHYEPPPPPPTPMPSPPTRWALVSMGLGLLLLVAPTLVALRASDLVHVAGVLMICAGVGILVARMRHEDEDDDDSDDGAVV